jgi:D-tyrosyl-tRNA(Tyr) deacylase
MKTARPTRALSDVGGSILSISQFTLYANAKEGNRPSFVEALRPELAKPLFALWNNELRERMPSLQTGVFGADMKVSLINDGPFTLWLDSDELFGRKA